MAIPRPHLVINSAGQLVSKHVSESRALRKISDLNLAEPGEYYNYEYDSEEGDSRVWAAMSKPIKPALRKPTPRKAKPKMRRVARKVAAPAMEDVEYPFAFTWDEIEMLTDLVQHGAKVMVWERANDQDASAALDTLLAIGRKLRNHMFAV